MNTISAGKEIVCYCGRCRMDLSHTIVAVAQGKPVRVICRTCRSEHIYRGKKGIKDPLKPGESSPGYQNTDSSRRRVASGSGTTKAATKTVPVEVEWHRQMNATNKPVRVYAADQTFVPEDKISHPTFGLGIVQKLVYPNKVEILFQMDLKTLIHKP